MIIMSENWDLDSIMFKNAMVKNCVARSQSEQKSRDPFRYWAKYKTCRAARKTKTMWGQLGFSHLHYSTSCGPFATTPGHPFLGGGSGFFIIRDGQWFAGTSRWRGGQNVGVGTGGGWLIRNGGRLHGIRNGGRWQGIGNGGWWREIDRCIHCGIVWAW